LSKESHSFERTWRLLDRMRR